MYIFLKKSSYFIGISLFFIFILIATLNYINNKIATSKSLDDSITTIFCGDSHIELAIDPTLLKNTFNVAKSNESFYFTYFKLKAILNNNTSIKQVCLGFSYHSLSSYYDKFIYGKFSTEISSEYFCLLPFNERIRILFANRNNLLIFIKNLIRAEILNLFSDKKSYQGGYVNSFINTNANEKSIEKRILFQYWTEGTLNDFSFQNIEYLIKIKDLCEKSNINLLLVSTPVFNIYKSKVPKKSKALFLQLPEKLKFKILDISDILVEDYFFIPDGDHVSQKGAIETSKYLANNFYK